MKRLLLILAFFCPVLMSQDLAHIGRGSHLPRLTIVWVGEMPVVLTGGHFWGPSWVPGPKPDHISATYISKGGSLITVYVDCSKRTSKKCVDAFKRRYDVLTKFFPVDEEATRKRNEREPKPKPDKLGMLWLSKAELRAA